MTSPNTPRRPRVFDPDAANIETDTFDSPGEREPQDADGNLPEPETTNGSKAKSSRLSFGGLLITALVGLAVLAMSVSFARFVSVALSREDWIGWTATALLGVAAVCATVILIRELLGLLRLGHLVAVRKDAARALSSGDLKLERATVSRLQKLFAGRRDLRWPLARLRDHEIDVRDSGDLLRLAERELLVPLDTAARQLIITSARRVSVVTAVSPIFWIAMIYVAMENLRLLKGLGGLYGGRPGGLGALRLARMVFAHVLATGGLALTDDLLGQFLGQDLLRRLSRRLGEGAFNGALTARIGTAAVEVIRPLPFREASPVRLRDLLAGIFRRTRQNRDRSSTEAPSKDA
jgi:putative membrane protein